MNDGNHVRTCTNLLVMRLAAPLSFCVCVCVCQLTTFVGGRGIDVLRIELTTGCCYYRSRGYTTITRTARSVDSALGANGSLTLPSQEVVAHLCSISAVFRLFFFFFFIFYLLPMVLLFLRCIDPTFECSYCPTSAYEEGQKKIDCDDDISILR